MKINKNNFKKSKFYTELSKELETAKITIDIINRAGARKLNRRAYILYDLVLSDSQVIGIYANNKTGVVDSIKIDDMVFNDIDDDTPNEVAKKLGEYAKKRTKLKLKQAIYNKVDIGELPAPTNGNIDGEIEKLQLEKAELERKVEAMGSGGNEATGEVEENIEANIKEALGTINSKLLKIYNQDGEINIDYFYDGAEGYTEYTIDKEVLETLKIDEIADLLSEAGQESSTADEQPKITKENIAELYPTMSETERKGLSGAQLSDITTGEPIISSILARRANTIRSILKIHIKEFDNFIEYTIVSSRGEVLEQSIFGSIDNLEPIEEYIAEIKTGAGYRLYIAKKRRAIEQQLKYQEEDELEDEQYEIEQYEESVAAVKKDLETLGFTVYTDYYSVEDGNDIDIRKFGKKIKETGQRGAEAFVEKEILGLDFVKDMGTIKRISYRRVEDASNTLLEKAYSEKSDAGEEKAFFLGDIGRKLETAEQIQRYKDNYPTESVSEQPTTTEATPQGATDILNKALTLTDSDEDLIEFETLFKDLEVLKDTPDYKDVFDKMNNHLNGLMGL